jgi:nickel-dependent lactate racemase
MKIVKLPFGNKKLHLHVPDKAAIMRGRPMKRVQNPQKEIIKALKKPTGSDPLHRIVLKKEGKSACIVVSDQTRPVPYKLILPPLLGELESAGISRSRITILIATGMHRPMNGKEQKEWFGPAIAKKYRVINHTGSNPRSTADTGKRTPSGAKLLVNKHYVHADIKILTGLIEPHFMAGFSGGRKSVMPGIVNLKALQQFHGAKLLSHAKAANGMVKGNPVHREALGAAKAVGADFILNAIITPDRNIGGIYAGHLEKAWEQGIADLERYVTVRSSRTFDLVVTTGGGAPLDRTFYQSVKGMVSALPLLHKRSKLLIVSGCEEGIGSREYRDILFSYSDNWKRFLKDIHKTKKVCRDQWEFQMQTRVLERIGVENTYLFSQGIAYSKQKKLSLTPFAM